MRRLYLAWRLSSNSKTSCGEHEGCYAHESSLQTDAQVMLAQCEPLMLLLFSFCRYHCKHHHTTGECCRTCLHLLQPGALAGSNDRVHLWSYSQACCHSRCCCREARATSVISPSALTPAPPSLQWQQFSYRNSSSRRCAVDGLCSLMFQLPSLCWMVQTPCNHTCNACSCGGK